MTIRMEPDRAKYRKFAGLLLLTLLVFAVSNYLIWRCYTRELLVPGSKVSDLVRLSYLVKITQEREDGVDLPRRHVDIGDYTGGPVDMVTVGDSFSTGGGWGKNAYYQDYIASNSNVTVVNFPSKIDASRPGFYAPISNLATLYNSGMLDRLKPRYVLLESVERYAPERLVFNFSFDDSEPLEKLLAEYSKKQPVSVAGEEGAQFINTGNLKFVVNNIKDLFPVAKINSNVYRLQLRQPFFEGKLGDRLYYYRDEYRSSVSLSRDTVRAMNDNLNFIADKLAAKNIRLIFMPVVSKLTLYGAYAEPPCNHSIFFEELRKLPKRYQYIDTKELLTEAVQRGEKDVFYKDDTHWSWKASQQIFTAVRFD